MSALDHLPYGVFSTADRSPRAGVLVDDRVLDLADAAEAGLLDVDPALFTAPSLNAFMAAGRPVWRATREALRDLLQDDVDSIVPLAEARLHLPFEVADYVDFYSSRAHAENLGRLFRPGSDPLTPNWLHLPIGYHGRAGTVVISGTPVRRPNGQVKPPDADASVFRPSTRLDIELELGLVIGTPSELGEPVSADDALEHVFGVVLVNDWSARDLQAWEYVPLGPFLGKSFATSIAAWVTPVEQLLRATAEARTSPPPPVRRARGLRHRPRDRPQRRDHLAHQFAQPLLDARAADRAPDLQRRRTTHGRSARIRDDLRGRAGQPRQPDRAHVERRRAARARRRLDAHIPGGRRRGRPARTLGRFRARRGARPDRAGRLGAFRRSRIASSAQTVIAPTATSEDSRAA